VVAHVAAHELGAAAYAIEAARAAAPGCEERGGPLECRWQREQLPDAIRELVLDWWRDVEEFSAPTGSENYRSITSSSPF
jgi:hypothetical protein